jgi:hypothetical protein
LYRYVAVPAMTLPTLRAAAAPTAHFHKHRVDPMVGARRSLTPPDP